MSLYIFADGKVLKKGGGESNLEWFISFFIELRDSFSKMDVFLKIKLYSQELRRYNLC